MSLADRTPPTVDEYNAYKERFSNWGRWGEDDQLGTLNHITPTKRAAPRARSCAKAAPSRARNRSRRRRSCRARATQRRPTIA